MGCGLGAKAAQLFNDFVQFGAPLFKILQLAVRHCDPCFLLQLALGVFVVKLQPLPDFFKAKAEAPPPEDQGHPRHFAWAVIAGAPLTRGGEQFDIFVMAKGSGCDAKAGAHLFEINTFTRHAVTAPPIVLV